MPKVKNKEATLEVLSKKQETNQIKLKRKQNRKKLFIKYFLISAKAN